LGLAARAVLAGALGAAGVLGAAPAALAAPPAPAAITIAAPAGAVAGDVIDVVISAKSVTDLYAWEADLAYDPALLAYVPDSAEFAPGGFDVAAEAAGVLSLAHTRLGSSPGLSGDLTLATVQLTVLAAGQGALDLDSITLVNSADEAATIDDAAAAAVALAAAPTPTPTPTPTTTPSPTLTATPTPTPSPTPSPTKTAGGALAVTGPASGNPLAAALVAAAGIGLGAALVLRRRQAVSHDRH
jgi:hypothetical protein